MKVSIREIISVTSATVPSTEINAVTWKPNAPICNDWFWSNSGNRHERDDAGFSLLEMLLVVALIGILAAYAVPTYQGYMQETRFMEVVQQTQSIRVAQSACLMQAGHVIAACDAFADIAMSAPVATDNTASVAISVTTGVITGTGTTASGNYTYVLTPQVNTAGALTYTVTGTCVAAGVC